MKAQNTSPFHIDARGGTQYDYFMSQTGSTLARIEVMRYLDEVNRYLLHGDGEIIESPGKLSLVWTDPVYDTQRYLAVKAAGDDFLLINGRRYPATTEGLKQGLRASLIDLRK